MSQSIKGVAMIRVSTAGQAAEDRAGIPAQREACRRIALQHGIEIVRTFELVDLSGAKVLTSPDYQQFLSELERPEIGAVVTKEFSRLMRPENFEDFIILQRFQDCRVVLYMPDGPIDLDTRMGRMMGGMRALMAGLERLEIRQRMMDGKEAMRRQGKHPSALHCLPRGIRYSKKDGWTYDEERLASVRLLFAAFLGGNHNYESLSKLTGIPRSSVRVILCNTAYAGTMTYDTKHDLSSAGLYPMKSGATRQYRRKVRRADDEIIRTKLPMEPLITPAQHEMIANIVEGRRAVTQHVRSQHGERFVYRGYLRCASCHQPMYTHVTMANIEKTFYYCRTKNPRDRARLLEQGIACDARYMSRNRLEQIIDRSILERLTDKGFLTSIIENDLQKTHVPTVASESFDGDLRRKEQRINDAYFDGNISAAEWRARLRKLETQREQIRTVQPRLRPEFDPAQILSIVKVFRKWHLSRFSDKRTILSRILPEIQVYNYQVKGAKLLLGGCDTDNRPKEAGIVTTSSKALPVREIFIPFEKLEESYA
jgi:DNA invertase Pin-like site-specific DNA recombinase